MTSNSIREDKFLLYVTEPSGFVITESNERETSWYQSDTIRETTGNLFAKILFIGIRKCSIFYSVIRKFMHVLTRLSPYVT